MIRRLLLSCSLLGLSLVTAAAGAETIRIGTTQSLSGDFREFGTEQLRGLQMWVDDVNARGALLGRRVELAHHDDGSDAARSVALYRQMIAAEQVDLLVAPYSSELTLEASLVAEEHGIPMVAGAASAERIWSRGLRNIFGVDTPAGQYMDLALEVAADRGAESVALVYAETPFADDVVVGVRARAREHGLQLVLDERYPQAQRDFTTLADRLGKAGADVILGVSYLEDSVAIVRALKAAGVRADMLAFTVGPALREFGDQLGADAEGVVGVVQWLRSVPLPTAQDFAYRYRKRYGNNPGVHAALGYSAGQVLEAAVRLAGTTDPAAVRAQLQSMQFRSLLGLYIADENGRQVGKSNFLLQWQQDRRRLVAPGKVAERELVYPLP
jgi:branched-chain amino acid transport system substrate-binding protein